MEARENRSTWLDSSRLIRHDLGCYPRLTREQNSAGFCTHSLTRLFHPPKAGLHPSDANLACKENGLRSAPLGGRLYTASTKYRIHEAIDFRSEGEPGSLFLFANRIPCMRPLQGSRWSSPAS